MPSIAIAENDSDIAYIPFAHPAPSRKIGLVYRKTSARKAAILKLAELVRSTQEEKQKSAKRLLPKHWVRKIA